MAINNSDRPPVDLESGLSAGSGRSAAGANMAQQGRRQGRDYLAAGLGLLFVYYLGFVFVLANFAEKWWHALLGIAFATACVMLSFCMAARITTEDAPRPSGTDGDPRSRLLASANTES